MQMKALFYITASSQIFSFKKNPIDFNLFTCQLPGKCQRHARIDSQHQKKEEHYLP